MGGEFEVAGSALQDAANLTAISYAVLGFDRYDIVE